MLRYLASLAVAAGALAAATSAQAQVAFDWGGDTMSDSGKQTVKFNHPARPGDIIVSFSDRKLYFITAPGIADAYPIAIPREQSRWEGVTSVSQKRENPAWTPTPSMLAENPRLPRWVPGGHPMNPLGNRALYLGSSAYRIHGTDAPWTIGTAASKGCVRLFNKDVADLYPRVKMGAKVTVTWKSFGGGKGNEVATKPTSSGGDDSARKSKSASGPQSYASANSAATSLFSDSDEQPQAAANDAASEPVARKSDKQRVDRKPKARAAAAAKEEATAVSAPVQPPAAENGTGGAVAQTAVAPAKPPRKGTDDKSASKSRKTSPIETGSVASEASPRLAVISATDPAEIAARAEAAANRAADAAERAAAAAERVLQQRSAKTAVE